MCRGRESFELALTWKEDRTYEAEKHVPRHETTQMVLLQHRDASKSFIATRAKTVPNPKEEHSQERQQTNAYIRCSYQARLGPLQLEDEVVVSVSLQGLHSRLGVALLVVRHERKAPALHRLGILRQVHPVCRFGWVRTMRQRRSKREHHDETIQEEEPRGVQLCASGTSVKDYCWNFEGMIVDQRKNLRVRTGDR